MCSNIFFILVHILPYMSFLNKLNFPKSHILPYLSILSCFCMYEITYTSIYEYLFNIWNYIYFHTCSFINHIWPYLSIHKTIYEHIWAYLNEYEHFLPGNHIFFHIFSYMPTFCIYETTYIFIYPVKNNHIWPYMVMYGPPYMYIQENWPDMHIYGQIWSYIILYAPPYDLDIFKF